MLITARIIRHRKVCAVMKVHWLHHDANSTSALRLVTTHRTANSKIFFTTNQSQNAWRAEPAKARKAHSIDQRLIFSHLLIIKSRARVNTFWAKHLSHCTRWLFFTRAKSGISHQHFAPKWTSKHAYFGSSLRFIWPGLGDDLCVLGVRVNRWVSHFTISLITKPLSAAQHELSKIH